MCSKNTYTVAEYFYLVIESWGKQLFLVLLGTNSTITFQHIVIQVVPQGRQFSVEVKKKKKKARIWKYSPLSPSVLNSSNQAYARTLYSNQYEY